MTPKNYFVENYRMTSSSQRLCELQTGIHSFFKNIIIYYFVKGVTDILDFSKKKLNYYRVREKLSYPLVPRIGTVLNLVVQNPRVLVQKVLSGS